MFPDHIERLMNGLKDKAADMVFSLVGIVEHDQRIVMSPSWTGDYESVGVIARLRHFPKCCLRKSMGFVGVPPPSPNEIIG